MFGFVFFVTMYLIGEFLSDHFSLPFPGAVIGLGLVLAVFVVRGGVDPAFKDAADTFLRYLALMLVPIGVGAVKLVDAAPADVWKLEVVLVLALIIGAVLTAAVMKALLALQKSHTAPAESVRSEQTIANG